MTAIAYRDGIMAADTGTLMGDTLINDDSLKIVRAEDGTLVGAAGEAFDCERILRWAREGFKEYYPKCGGRMEALVVEPDGQVFIYNERGDRLQTSPHWATIGSASDFMSGALAHGATAEEAVALSITYHALSIGRVYSIRRDEPQPILEAAE